MSSNYGDVSQSFRDIRIAVTGIARFEKAVRDAAKAIASFQLVATSGNFTRVSRLLSKRKVTKGEVEHSKKRSVDDKAVQVYLKSHKRLPGSNRTSRLQKKRATLVREWYQKQEQKDKVTA